MNKIVAALAVVLLAGCASAAPTMRPAAQSADVPAAPSGGRRLDTEFGPRGLSIPEGASIVEKIDQVNNVTLVFSSPDGAELLSYYRSVLPELGFRITADAGEALLFNDGQWHGAFTVGDKVSALTLRTDWNE